VEVRHGAAILDLPDTLELRERRSLPRARVNNKEGATFTALTGLFEGVGITGALENVSETGARVRVEKGMSIKGEKRLSLGSGLVPVGQPFILVKLNKVPKCPAVMELEGQAVYLDVGNTGLIMGVKFTRPKADVCGALRGMVASRASAIPTTLPPKARRKPEAQSSGLLADEPLGKPSPREPMVEARPEPAPAKVEPPAPKPVAKPEVQPLPPVSEAAPVQPPSVVAPVRPPVPPPEEEAQAATSAKGDSLIRLKKRSRAIVALSRTPAFNDILKGFLQEDGYGRVFTTTFPDEIVEFLRQPNLGVLLLDGNMGIVESLEFVQKLRTQVDELPPVILAAEDISTAVVLAARRNGVTQLVVRPYALDATFSALLSEQIGLK
jgi:CheY-like chemotaxis protein